MRKPYAARPYQILAHDFMYETRRCSLWAGMGMGKTVSVLTLLDTLFLTGQESRPALVLAPLRVARQTWPREAQKWEHLRHIEVSAIVGTVEERSAALRRDASVYTINYENLPWLFEKIGDRFDYGTVVADESTRLKNLRIVDLVSPKGNQFLRAAGGKRARALGKAAVKNRDGRWINLTGTPAPNGLRDLWGQIYFVDQGARLGRSFTGFSKRWFQRSFDDYGLEPFPHSQEEIQGKLRDVCLTLDAKDWFDVHEPIVNTIPVQLPPKARKLYRDMEKQMFMELEGHEIEAFNAASRTIKCLQLANGAAYLDDSTADDRPWAEVHQAKLEALESVVEEAAGMPVLVSYWFKPDLARLKKAFPKGRHLSSDESIEDFRAGKIPVGFVQPASLGHGIDGLQDATNIICFFGHWWDAELHDQIIERIGPVRQIQAGFDRPVFIHYIVAENTIDEDVIERVQSKRSVQDILKAAMKRRAQ